MSEIEHCPECEAAWERGHKAGRAFMVAQGHDTWKDMHATVVDQLDEARQQLQGAVEAERQRIVERLLHAANLTGNDEVSSTKVTLEKAAMLIITEGGQSEAAALSPVEQIEEAVDVGRREWFDES